MYAVSVLDSDAGPCRLIGTGVDTSAISVSAGQGPIAIWNTKMVAGSENFSLSGGPTEVSTGTVSSPTTTGCTLSSTTNLRVDDNIALVVAGLYNAGHSTIVRSINTGTGAITYDPIPTAPDNGSTAKWAATPSYIEMERCWLYKMLEWRPSDPSFNGQNTQIKNLWEAKFGRYIRVHGCVLENTWAQDQDYGIVIAPRNVNGGNSEVAVIRNIDWRNNILKNATKGITLQAGDGTNYLPAVSPVQREQDITFRNCLFWRIGLDWDSSSAGHQFITFNGAAEQGNNTVFTQLQRIFVFHCTIDNGAVNANQSITDFGEANQGSGCADGMFKNNVMQAWGYGFKSNVSIVNQALNLQNFLPPGDSSNINKNLIVNTAGLTFPATFLTIPSAIWADQFVGYNSGNFKLVDGHVGKNAATDGTDVGVDMVALSAATLHTQDGNWGDPEPPPAHEEPHVRLIAVSV